MPIWICQNTSAPHGVHRHLLVNTASVILLQVRLSRVRGRGGRRAGVAALGLALAACCGLFAVAAGLPLLGGRIVLLVGAIVHVLGEMLHAPGLGR